MKSMIFWGATGQAKVLKEFVESSNLKLVAVFDNNKNVPPPFPDIPLYFGKEGFEKWFSSKFISHKMGFLVAIGGDKGKDRCEIQEYLKSYGLIPLVAKHPLSFVADNAIIGEGSQILAQSSVCVETKIGKSCIINTGATVDHECVLGDGVHICPGAHIAGSVKIEDYSTIGMGAIVLPRLTIGRESFVGAGAIVFKDVPRQTVVVGNPAKILSEKIQKSEKDRSKN